MSSRRGDAGRKAAMAGQMLARKVMMENKDDFHVMAQIMTVEEAERRERSLPEGFRDHVRTDGTVDDTQVETFYRPLEYISVPHPFKPYLRVVCDDGLTNIETRIPFDLLVRAGWTPPES